MGTRNAAKELRERLHLICRPERYLNMAGLMVRSYRKNTKLGRVPFAFRMEVALNRQLPSPLTLPQVGLFED
jgi:hypothetical protein